MSAFPFPHDGAVMQLLVGLFDGERLDETLAACTRIGDRARAAMTEDMAAGAVLGTADVVTLAQLTSFSAGLREGERRAGSAHKALLLDVVNALPDDYDAVWNALGYPVENYYPSDCPPLEVYRRRAAGLLMRLREVAGELPKLSVPDEDLCAGCDEVLDDPEKGVQFQVGSQVFFAHDNEDCPEDAADRLKGFDPKEAP